MSSYVATMSPYMGPYEIVERISDRLFKINVDGHEKNLSVDRLKPAHIANEDIALQHQPLTPAQQHIIITEPRHQVKFQNLPPTSINLSGGGVDVVPATSSPSANERRHVSTDHGALTALSAAQANARGARRLRLTDRPHHTRPDPTRAPTSRTFSATALAHYLLLSCIIIFHHILYCTSIRDFYYSINSFCHLH